MYGLTRAVLATGIAWVLAGCPEGTLECVEFEPTCAPLYPPTWTNVYANTFGPKCGLGDGSCHGGATSPGGLQLDDPDRAYDNLMTSGRAYVIAGDPSCSEVVERMRVSSSRLLMPRGSRLPDAEICAIEQWIAAGAPGPEAPTADGDARVTGP